MKELPTVESCGACRYWRRLEGWEPDWGPGTTTSNFGECHRRPPIPTNGSLGDWPVTESSSDWCGEFALAKELSQ